jgi:putative ATPase
LYIARRLLRFSSEDVGLADPFAFVLAQTTFQTCQVIGYPESDCSLAECVIYLALAPKSNSAYTAIQKAKEAVAQNPDEPVPLFIRNAPTSMMKNFGYGKGYEYPHDVKDKIVKTHYLPERLKKCVFYTPGEEGKESQFKNRYLTIRKKLDYDETD